MPALIITVDCKDSSDLDWLRMRALASVEEVVADAEDEKRLDAEVEVSWDIEEN